MKTEIHKKNIEISEYQKDYVNTKIEKIASMWRMMNDETSVIKVSFEQLSVKDKHNNISCHIVINLPKQTITTTESWQSVQETIDLAEDKILHQLSTYKGKYYSHK